MKIKNLGLDSTIPYKLSNIVYHFEKFLYNYSSGKTLKEYKSFIKENDLETLILTKTPSVLLDSVIERIMVGDWDEISYNMDYSNSDKLLLTKFFRLIYPDYVNKTKDWEEFYKQLLQDNLDDLVIEEDEEITADTLIDEDEIDTDELFNVLDYLEGNEEITADTLIDDDNFIAEYHKIILENKISVEEYLLTIYNFVTNKINEYNLTDDEEVIELYKWCFDGLVKNKVYGIGDWKEFFINAYNENPEELSKKLQNDNPVLFLILNNVDFFTLDYDGFVANAYYTISNSISLEIEIADSGDALRIKNNNNISDWLPIDYKIDEYGDNEEDTIPYVMYGEMEIDLNNVMRIDNNYFENEITTDTLIDEKEIDTDKLFNVLDYLEGNEEITADTLIDEKEIDTDKLFNVLDYLEGNEDITADTLIDDDLENDIYDNYEIEINTLDIIKKYQEEKSLKGNVEFTLESDDNIYQVEFEYLNNTNQVNLFDIETLDGIVVEFNKNNLEIIKNEIIHQLNMYNELNIEDNKKIIENIITEYNNSSFPNKQIYVYYPFLNIESSLILNDDKLINLLNEVLTNEEIKESIKIINNYSVNLTPDYKDFKTLWDLIANTLINSKFENNEEIIYFSIPTNDSELKLKFYISAEIWNYIDELIK